MNGLNLHQRLSNALKQHGFSICHPLSSSTYNRFMGKNSRALPLQEDRLAFLIGNTRDLWPSFLSHLQKNEYGGGMKDLDNPLDEYTQYAIAQCIQQVNIQDHQLYFGHTSYLFNGEHRFLALQKMAHCSGLAYLDQDSYLCVHPEYGPWFALRAVLTVPLINGLNLDLNTVSILDNPISVELGDALRQKMKTLLTRGHETSWRDWVEMRRMLAQSIPGCSKWEYSPAQMEYHYTKNKKLLDI